LRVTNILYQTCRQGKYCLRVTNFLYQTCRQGKYCLRVILYIYFGGIDCVEWTIFKKLLVLTKFKY
jgi:hypothetical protein